MDEIPLPSLYCPILERIRQQTDRYTFVYPTRLSLLQIFVAEDLLDKIE